LAQKNRVESILILDKKQTQQKIKRLAFEIYENNFQEKSIILAGIYDKGYLFAQELKKELEILSPLKVSLAKISLNKSNPLVGNVELDISKVELKNKVVVVIDDVLNSGKTLIASLKPLLDIELKRIQIAVLVDRGYKSFPVAADYIGYSLSTTVKEHIEVVLDDSKRFGVYLK
jgi:pyrimidine operon attenuation protein/uracil phosphoribosyltransferase